MEQEDQGPVLKYFDVVDKFITIKTISRTPLLFKKRPNKDEYRKQVLSLCLDKKEVAEICSKTYDLAISIEDILYSMCIEVNPHLELNEVQIALPSPGKETLRLNLRGRDFLSLEERLNQQIIGQADIIAILVKTLKRSTSGLRDKHKPIGNFLFAGRTGTGKTELAKLLTKELKGYNLLLINGSEYAWHHEYAKLLGSPPGYIGHAEGGLLDIIVKNPKTVLLWDEIEKAHETVHNILLQIFEEGKVRSSSPKGKLIPFDQTINILTSNIGAEEADKYETRISFGKDTSLEKDSYTAVIKKALRENFRPELLNRMDAICVFNNLGFEECCSIASLRLDELRKRVKEKGTTLTYTPQVVEAITKRADYQKYAARDIKRVIESHIEDRVADILLSGKDSKTITITYENDEIRIK